MGTLPAEVLGEGTHDSAGRVRPNNGRRRMTIVDRRWLAAVSIVLVIVAIAGIAIIRPALERASRTTELADIVSAVAVHDSTDGRLVVTEVGDASGPNGRVLVIDPVTEQREVVLDDPWEVRPAAMSSAGIVCATLAGDRGASPELGCSDGRAFALVEPQGSVLPKAISPGDVVWDGESGWYVADLANGALLHVDAAGRVAALPTTFQIPSWSNVPGALAITSDGRVLVALSECGVVVGWPAMDIRQVVVADGLNTIVGIALSKSGTFVLARNKNTNVGEISWCCHSAGSYQDTILDGINVPRGLALLPDGRLAIVSDGKVLLYRPDQPEGGA